MCLWIGTEIIHFYCCEENPSQVRSETFKKLRPGWSRERVRLPEQALKSDRGGDEEAEQGKHLSQRDSGTADSGKKTKDSIYFCHYGFLQLSPKPVTSITKQKHPKKTPAHNTNETMEGRKSGI